METLRHRRPSKRRYRILPSSFSGSSQEQRNLLWKILKKVSLKFNKFVTVEKLKAIVVHRKRSNSGKFQEPLMDSINHNGIEEDQIPFDQVIQKVPKSQKLHHNSRRMKIYVKIPSNQKTSVFEAKEFHIINDIKSMIQLKEGILSNQYTLVHGGNLLQDYRSLASLNIHTESTLHMIFNPRDVMLIFVKIPSGKIVQFEVKVLYTIRDVKQIVESFIGCSVVECSMVYEGIELQDLKTLAFYSIEENSTLEVKPYWIQIFVKTWSGKTITLDVTQSNTVREVKEKIFCKVRVPVMHQSIVFAGKRLQDKRSLSSYNIHKQSTLHMVMAW
ncbi:PREDICTED: polyubiquitin-like [Fragaria vesca subsp. vesca]|uniref:polyubiquitin-like n=1 Tax=Fragaria vesca subsp. vesca TaxID=101020 RepID=UPI0002C2F40F|nr:PREDICTED: polyubiquitin-like [Fragaria vesca subsp. vesca]